ncbi:glutamate--tRNA ligase [Clostridium gelidum]|uniref:Glutamate--tRNA ligase n=1 Tax=Clostridium gelidum TaxID=704125 RepID=A0ABN6J495_9CLOT|nr:glutamate--tRNA ligase [Clostridium gelidum]BCZ48320.1 glutamate--tRNA ligase [Clostridium gelidum]
MNFGKIAEMIFNNVEHTTEYYIEKYPKRNLKEGARVTRYAPSPTGFQHIGGIFAALINERLASQSEGVFYLRIEDTDQKREVEGAIDDTIATMHNFGMDFNEGMTGQETSKGEYAPYRQSQRADIYNTFAKDLLKKGLAYPCFCTPEELAELRERQIANKITPGYYGEYAKFRNITEEEAIKRIENGEQYIIRLKSPGTPEKRVEFHDLIKGDISFPENNQDIVLIKGDGLPTYHFAHAIDDFLMRTTDVIRGEEWLSSLPIHVQLFEVLGFEAPRYAHIPTIMKQDGGSKRKLSKRKDPEAAVSYYKEVGFPTITVIEYLLNIVNSTFEEWRAENLKADYHEFEVHLEKMGKSGALFDLIKLNDVAKDRIAVMKASDVYENYIAWAKQFDEDMYKLVTENETMTKEMFNIDKEGPKPRKDFAKWDEVKDKVFYFFDELFVKETVEQIELPKGVTLESSKAVVETYKNEFNFNVESQEAWFDDLKEIGLRLGYCANRKDFKANPDQYKGMISDVAGAVRAALTHRTNSPDIYTIMQIIGEENTRSRFDKFLSL